MSLLRQNSVSEDTILRSHGNIKKQRCCHKADGFTVIFCCFSFLTAAITVALVIQIQLGQPEVTPHGAVASNSHECSDVGVTVLRGGGNAVDSTIATLLCLSVVHPHIVGPGGGGVMLVHDHKANKSVVIDFMVGIPSKHSKLGHFEQTGSADVKSIGIPGFMHGLEYAHKKHGKLPWKQLFVQAIDLAKNGFKVSSSLYEASASLVGLAYQKDDYRTDYFRDTFLPQGVKLQTGAVIKRETYAQFLEKAAEQGADTMWPLHFASEIINTLNDAGALVTQDDIEQYKVLAHPCIHTTINNNTIFTAPAPFDGPKLLLALHALHYYNMSKQDPLDNIYERFIKADLISNKKIFELITSKTDVTTLSPTTFMSLLNDTDITQDVQVLALNTTKFPEQATSEVTVIDTFDVYVSTVVGLGSEFGSRVMTEHGILFNNFVPESIAHLSHIAINDEEIQANNTIVNKQSLIMNSTSKSIHSFLNRRPLNPFTPVIITDQTQICGRRAVLSSGSAAAMMQVVAQMVFKDMNITDAIEEPRVATKPPSPDVYLDDTINGLKRLPSFVRKALDERNYKFTHMTPPIPSVNGVSKYKDGLSSQSDTRGGGFAARLETTSIEDDLHQASQE